MKAAALTPQIIALHRRTLLEAIADGEDVHLHLCTTGNRHYFGWTVCHHPRRGMCDQDRCFLLSELLGYIRQAYA